MHRLSHVCEEQRSMLGNISQATSYFFIFGRIFHFYLELPNIGLQMCLITCGFLCGFWEFNSDPMFSQQVLN